MATPPSAPPPTTFGDPSSFAAPPPGSGPGEAAPEGGWAVGFARGSSWWSGSWRLFKRAPLVWIVILIVVAVIWGCLMLLPIFGALAWTLLSPVFGAGILLGCRELDQGRTLAIGHLFAGFNDRLTSLVVVGLLYLLGWVAVCAVTFLVMAPVLGFGVLSALAGSGSPYAAFEAISAIGLGLSLAMLIALALSLPLVMAYWFAPALVIFRGDEPVAAMRNSFVACIRNVPPFLLYGLIGAAYAILASIPLFLGWIVLIPMLAASVFVSYEDIFGIPAWSKRP